MNSQNKYLDKLDALWQKHLESKPVNAPTVISLFAGCGGSSLGYSMAGFREVLAVEWDKNAAATFRLNFPDTPIYQGDINELTDAEALRISGMKSGQLDLLDGSPPCQGFSTAGKRELTDNRNDLFTQYIRLLRAFRPRIFVMENVSGLAKGKMRLILAEIFKELRASGYIVKMCIMDAAGLGVPQYRKRTIFIGIRKDLKLVPTFPEPLREIVTVMEAIGHLPEGKKGNHSPEVIGAWYRCQPNISLRKVNKFVGSFQSVRLNPSKPSPTQIKAHRNWRWDIPRQLTIKEMALIQSFPEQFHYRNNISLNQHQIGNSVPPLMMYEIARHLKENFP